MVAGAVKLTSNREPFGDGSSKDHNGNIYISLASHRTGEEGRPSQCTADESLPFFPCREAVKPTQACVKPNTFSCPNQEFASARFWSYA